MNNNQKQTYEGKSGKGFYRISAILLIVAGIGGVVLSRLSGMLYASGVPSGTIGYLQLFSQHVTLANTDWTLWILVNITIILPSIAMYLVLRNVNKTVAVLGSAISIAYIVYDDLVTEASSLKLVSLSQSYTVATGAAKASILSQATNIVNALPLMTFFSFTVGAVGWLLWSVLMPKTFFRRTTAVFGVIVNIMGILGGIAVWVSALGIFNVFGALLTALWFILVGAQLLRQQHRPTNAVQTGAQTIKPTPM